MNSGDIFHVKYSTLYFTFVKCVLCEAKYISAAAEIRPFLFLQKRNKKRVVPQIAAPPHRSLFITQNKPFPFGLEAQPLQPGRQGGERKTLSPPHLTDCTTRVFPRQKDYVYFSVIKRSLNMSQASFHTLDINLFISRVLARTQ